MTDAQLQAFFDLILANQATILAKLDAILVASGNEATLAAIDAVVVQSTAALKAAVAANKPPK